MTVRQHVHNMSPEAGITKWNAAIINGISCTCGFPAMMGSVKKECWGLTNTTAVSKFI